MEIAANIFNLVTILTLVFSGTFILLFWLKNRHLDSGIVRKRIKNNSEYQTELENQIKSQKRLITSLNGKINYKNKQIMVEGDYDLEEKDGISGMIQELIPNFAEFIPKKYQSLLNNPKLINTAIELYEKHPEEAKNFLAGFLKKSGSKQNGSQTSQPETSKERTLQLTPDQLRNAA